MQKLIEMAELKDRTRRHKPLLVVMGCMAERYRQEILEELPEVDVILGANTWQDILEAIGQKLSQQEPVQKYRDISENVFLSKPVPPSLLGEYDNLSLSAWPSPMVPLGQTVTLQCHFRLMMI